MAQILQKLEEDLPASAATADLDVILGAAAHDAKVTKVTYTPTDDITGAATNYRTISVVNTGTDGDGTTVVATYAFSASNKTASDNVAKAITLSATAADLEVDAGDVLVARSEHSGSSGMADPGGLVHVELGPSATLTSAAKLSTDQTFSADATTAAARGWWGSRPNLKHDDEEYALTTGPNSPTGANGPE